MLRGFHLDGLVPVWEYEVGGARVRRKLMMVHGENTLFVMWEHVSGPEVEPAAAPLPRGSRPHDLPIPSESHEPSVRIQGARMEMQATPDAPPMRLRVRSSCAAPFVSLGQTSQPLLYRTERSRGYDHTEVQHSPGYFECTVGPGQPLALGVTTEDWWVLDREPAHAFELEQERERKLLERAPEEARRGVPARLVLAADQFIIDPTRPADDAWARAIGQDARSVIAGYHWFTDWGRDTMISHEGLTLCTGRYREAAAILRTFQHYVKNGLIPNYFPDGENDGVYHTADATMWFFHAVDRYLETTGDEELLRDMFPTLASIVEHHQKGTRFNIGVDPADGLLKPGPGGLPAHVDGRQGGRLGGDAPAGQGGGDQRAVVQRAAADGDLGGAAGQGSEPVHGGGGAGVRQLQQALLERGRTGACSTWWTARTGGTIRPSGPTRSSPSRCGTRCCGASAGRRCWRWCSGIC